MTEERDEDELLRLYLTEIGKYPLLGRDDEAKLATAVQRGVEASLEMRAAGEQLSTERRRELRGIVAEGEHAQRRLVESNLRLVVSVAKQHRSRDRGLLDLIQEGNLGLMRAVERYDTGMGLAFQSFAKSRIRDAIASAA